MGTSMKLYMKPTSIIETQLGIQRMGPAHAYFTELCEKEMDPYVPMSNASGEDGHLAELVRHTTNQIIYNKDYAHYMWEGRVMGPNIPIIENGQIVGYWSKAPKYYTGEDIIYSTSNHPLATSHWDSVMWSAKKEDIEKQVKEFVDRGCK